MRKGVSLFFVLFFLAFGPGLFAQEEITPEEEFPEQEWEEIVTAPYNSGDRSFVITLGLLVPTIFGGEIENNQHGMKLGGTASLAYNYFLTKSIFAGVEVGWSFSSTRGKNMLHMVPFGGRIGYQFLFWRFEIPVSIMIGGITQAYLGKTYFGPIFKPGASLFWRFNPNWSFGLNTNWSFIPQWPRNGHAVYGNFMELTLSARYHF